LSAQDAEGVVGCRLPDADADAVQPGGPPAQPSQVGRVVSLDGLRGLAALYVAAFHCRLLSFRDFPIDTGPRWLAWLMYGRVAVVFFLALSGFSLAISAAKNGWRLGGLARYARRRAWRILPAYWAALAVSLVVAREIVPATYFGPPTKRSVAVYGLLLQDIVSARTPNGAMWSIAVEVELYVVFPLLLLLRRRLGTVLLLAAVLVPAVVLGLLAPNRTPAEGMNGLTWHLAPIFVLGLVAAGIVVASERIRRVPWHWLAALAALPPVLLIAANGSVWTAGHYFWVDLLAGPSMVMLLVAVAVGRPAILVRLLATRPLRSLGACSYSLYLIHLPIVMIISRKFVRPEFGYGVTAFWLTIGFGVPISVLAARGFAEIFELPFQRYRSWGSLVAAVRARWSTSTRAVLDRVAGGRPVEESGEPADAGDHTRA
jgi:peptidoglycan/LPS O-acetylase OafA/YrhL